MRRIRHSVVAVFAVLALLPAETFAQAPPKSTKPQASSTLSAGLDLVEKGHCKEALPILQLANVAPGSYQAHELNAESLETQGKWDEAAAEYRLILDQNANLPGIHFRFGRLILSKPETPTTATDAKKEFEAELKIDPNNAGAEYVLGELSAQAQQWDDAIEHFSRATKLDAGFRDAILGLGSSFVSAGKFAEAIPPLEKYVKIEPGNPAGHYQLAIAYSRAGRKEDAKREAALQKETTEKIEQEKQRASDAIHKQSSGQGTEKPEPPN